MPKTLKTNDCVWTQVFRRIVRQVELDAEIRRVVGGDRIRSWKGVPADKSPLVPATGAPLMRLTPNPSGVDWYSPDSQAGTLSVQVEIYVASLCIDDVANLWDLVVVACSPCQPGFAQALIAAGAETGEIVFGDPAFDPRPDVEPEGYFAATGRLRLTVIRSVNP